MFSLDRWSYFEWDPFTPESQPMGFEGPLFWVSAGVFVACWIPLVLCCHAAARYSRATGNVLREYAAKLQSDLLRHQAVS